MMRAGKQSATVLALILTVLCADSASQAQNPGRGRRGDGDRIGQGRPGGPGGGFGFGGGRRGGADVGSLLQSEQVRTELKLEESQQEKLESILADVREKSRELMSGLRDLSGEERRARRDELQAKRQEMQANTRKQLETVLSTTQVKRLDQIMFQVRGINALVDSEYSGKLSITDEQKQTLGDILAAQRDMQRELFGSMRDLRDLGEDERAAKLAELRTQGMEIAKETEAAALEVLTAEQRTAYATMQGAPFELDRRSLLGGRRGGQRGQRGRGEGGRGPGDDNSRNRPQRPDSV